MSEGNVVFISGATGIRAHAVNGPYDRTSEMSNGYNVYNKRGDASVCIEHGAGAWEIKHVADKGKISGFASVNGGCELEDCTSRTWKVQSLPIFSVFLQVGVKMVSGQDAQQKVSGCCIHATQLAGVRVCSLFSSL